MNRLRKPCPHDAGIGDRAIESGERHHVHDGPDAGAGLSNHLANRAGEFDFGRGVRAVAELVLQTLEAQAVVGAVAQYPRHQEARKPLIGLRKHQECVRHRRGHEPFVTCEPVETRPCPLGARRVRPDVGAALLFRHSHAERQPGLVYGRLLGLVVFARGDARCPFAEYLRVGHESGERGVRHGYRAKMPAFELRGQVEAGRARLVPAAGLVLVVFPYRGVQADGYRTPHKRMVGRMEFDEIDAPALPVVGPQLRRLGVGETRKLLRLAGADITAELVEFAPHRLGIVLGKLDKQWIGTPRACARQRRALILHVMRQFETPMARFQLSRTVTGKPADFAREKPA